MSWKTTLTGLCTLLAALANAVKLLSDGDPLTMPERPATIYRAKGIPPHHGYDVETRPFYVTSDGKGRAVRELFA
jgi:hypothetical protein